MRSPASFIAAILAAAGVTLFAISAALAGGSISLDEVMEQLKDEPKLIAELDTELKSQGLKAEDVICSGARFGNQWTNLGGARAIPYTCALGSRTIDIDGELHLLDAAGNELDMDGEDTPQKAADYKQLHLTWKWS
jgi:hypothetical protein